MTAVPLSAAQLAHARHELRTPVNAIIGYSEMLLEDTDTDSAATEALQSVQALGKRLQGLIGEHLDAGRLNAQPAAEVLAAEVRLALLPPTQQVLEACHAVTQVAEAAVAPLLPDVEKIATAARRLVAMLDDPLHLGASPPAAGQASPLAQSPAQEGTAALQMEAVDESLPASEEEFNAGRRGNILVVDDNQFNREMLARGLHKQKHWFALAQNGRQALDMLEGGGFDLVLLDILMPELDGFEVLKRLKANPAQRHVPVIMISALDQIDSVVRCIEMGAEDYLPKPFNPVLLKARVGACLEKKRLRDQELEYLRNVARVTAVAAEVEAGTFRPEALDKVARRTDSLGQLARVFQSMVHEVQAREERLKQEVQQLRIEIDEGRKAHQVAEITETDYFQELQMRAKALKARQRPAHE
jgi:DNA-binding response OmpR family regulator